MWFIKSVGLKSRPAEKSLGEPFINCDNLQFDKDKFDKFNKFLLSHSVS